MVSIWVRPLAGLPSEEGIRCARVRRDSPPAQQNYWTYETRTTHAASGLSITKHCFGDTVDVMLQYDRLSDGCT